MTLWVFLSQVMSIHHGCVSAVAKLITYRVAKGLKACSAETGAYCIARDSNLTSSPCIVSLRKAVKPLKRRALIIGFGWATVSSLPMVLP